MIYVGYNVTDVKTKIARGKSGLKSGHTLINSVPLRDTCAIFYHGNSLFRISTLLFFKYLSPFIAGIPFLLSSTVLLRWNSFSTVFYCSTPLEFLL